MGKVKSNAKVTLGAETANLKVLRSESVSPGKLHFRDSALLGRSRPVADEEVIALADSMNPAAGGSGQQQPIQVRPMQTEGEYEVIFGNTRKRAADLIVAGYKSNDGKERVAQPNFTLRCEVVEVDDKTAFERVVVENAHRNQTSPIDNAINQQILREQYQLSDVAIAKLYGYAHSASVHRLKKLLTLPNDLQDRVHDGRLTLNAAVELCEFMAKNGPDAFSEVWASIVKPGTNEDDLGKLGSDRIGSQEVQEAIAAWKKAKKEAQKTAGTPAGEGGSEVPAGDAGTIPPIGEGTSSPTPDAGPTSNGTPAEKGKQRTVKQIKDILTQMKDGPKCPQIMKDLSGALLVVIDGGDLGEFVDFVKGYATAEELAKWDAMDNQQAEEQGTEQPAETEQPVA